VMKGRSLVSNERAALCLRLETRVLWEVTHLVLAMQAGSLERCLVIARQDEQPAFVCT
jgi:hypothetical protein